MAHEKTCAFQRFVYEGPGAPDDWYEKVAASAKVCLVSGCPITAQDVREYIDFIKADHPNHMLATHVGNSACKAKAEFTRRTG